MKLTTPIGILVMILLIGGFIPSAFAGWVRPMNVTYANYTNVTYINQFDQSLNTTDNVTFNTISISGDTGLIFNSLQDEWAFRYADGIGADDTGIRFNTGNSKYEFTLLNTSRFDIDALSGDVNMYGDLYLNNKGYNSVLEYRSNEQPPYFSAPTGSLITDHPIEFGQGSRNFIGSDYWNNLRFWTNSIVFGSQSFDDAYIYISAGLWNTMVMHYSDLTNELTFLAGDPTNYHVTIEGWLSTTGNITSTGGLFTSGTSAGTSHTYTMCASGACATTCTIITTGGLITGGTC